MNLSIRAYLHVLSVRAHVTENDSMPMAFAYDKLRCRRVCSHCRLVFRPELSIISSGVRCHNAPSLQRALATASGVATHAASIVPCWIIWLNPGSLRFYIYNHIVQYVCYFTCLRRLRFRLKQHTGFGFGLGLCWAGEGSGVEVE